MKIKMILFGILLVWIAAIGVVVADVDNASVSESMPTATATPEIPTVTATPEIPTVTATPEIPTVTATPEIPTVTATPEIPTTKNSENVDGNDENGVKAEANASAIVESNTSSEASVIIGAESNETIIKDNKGTTVITNVSAFAYSEGKGDNVSLASRAYAEGQIVRGAGGAYIEGGQTNAGVSITINALGNGLNGLTVMSYASGLDAIGYTWASAWAETIERFNKATEYIRRNTGRNTGFSGFIFGKSDTERYTYFKFQSINLSAKNSTRYRANYWMETIADDYGINRTQFEKKYNITTNKFGGVELVGINKNKNMVIVRINGTLYDIPYGSELDIEGKKINITEVNETNNIIGIKVVSLKGASS